MNQYAEDIRFLASLIATAGAVFVVLGATMMLFWPVPGWVALTSFGFMTAMGLGFIAAALLIAVKIDDEEKRIMAVDGNINRSKI